MKGQIWAVLIAAFLASTVEFVEAFTIVLVVGVTINWRSSLLGALAAVGALAVIVALLGPALVMYVPLGALRLVVGVLLVLFGLKWLKKAVLRYSGLKGLHDEEAIYEEQRAELRGRGAVLPQQIEPFGVATSFKSVLLEGLEVAFIVITFGSQARNIPAAAGGAVAALALVLALGALIRAPLQRVPENTLKFVVGVMLVSFGAFWGGEGLGISWWHEDAFLLALIAFFLAVTGLLVVWLRGYAPPRIASSPTELERPAQQEALR